jgi:hypothetical protein
LALTLSGNAGGLPVIMDETEKEKEIRHVINIILLAEVGEFIE